MSLGVRGVLGIVRLVSGKGDIVAEGGVAAGGAQGFGFGGSGSEGILGVGGRSTLSRSSSSGVGIAGGLSDLIDPWLLVVGLGIFTKHLLARLDEFNEWRRGGSNVVGGRSVAI